MSDATIDSLLDHLELAATQARCLAAQMRTELAPLLERPTRQQLLQRKDRYSGLHDDGFRLLRTKGDLILCRDKLIRARLSLDTLLDEADAAPTDRMGTKIACVHPDTLAFFSLLHHGLTSVMLTVWRSPKGQRAYDIDKSNWLDLSVPIDAHAHDIINDIGALPTMIQQLQAHVQTYAAKRRHVEAFEAEWHEDTPRAGKKARVDTQTTQ